MAIISTQELQFQRNMMVGNLIFLLLGFFALVWLFRFWWTAYNAAASLLPSNRLASAGFAMGVFFVGWLLYDTFSGALFLNQGAFPNSKQQGEATRNDVCSVRPALVDSVAPIACSGKLGQISRFTDQSHLLLGYFAWASRIDSGHFSIWRNDDMSQVSPNVVEAFAV